MSEKGEKTQKSPTQPDAVGAKINVFPPQDRDVRKVRPWNNVFYPSVHDTRSGSIRGSRIFCLHVDVVGAHGHAAAALTLLRVPESPYMDPATGRLIPIEERDWRRGAAAQGGPSAGTSAADAARTATDGQARLDPNELDFSIERKESRLPSQE